MIDRHLLLADLQDLLKRLEADLLERSESAEAPDLGKALRAEHERARAAERTAQNYEDWRADAITQVAAAWVLSCVFVRFLEDNRLIEPPKIAGPGERLQRARDEHEIYFRAHPKLTDRDYLLAVFDELAKRPGVKGVFGEHNPVRELTRWLSGDAAGELLRFFQKIDADSGALVHDFADPAWDTRFLGDLYQDLSEAARKKYALLQTPQFVEEFILDRTLDPAIDEFGLSAPAVKDRDGSPITAPGFRMIDPACGSGHFLLGSFRRILDLWQRREPGTKVRVLVQRALDSVHGVDVNPYAVAIARFRLLLAAMRASDVTRLADAPAFQIHIACGDSLLHAPLRSGQQVLDWELTGGSAEYEHAYLSEDLPQVKRLLQAGIYHAVVANPPDITPKDGSLNEAYRQRYHTCYRQYSLVVPFMERIFRLAVEKGFTGQITSNSFMKREFGKKLIEEFLPKIDLTHVIDTSGAYIPGHGTPTVILFGRHRPPVASTIRTVMGIRGEPSTPDDPSCGLVWSAIMAQLDHQGSRSEFVSVADSERVIFGKHPWSIGGGGAAELKVQLDACRATTLGTIASSIGFYQDTHADEAFVQPVGFSNRHAIAKAFLPQVRGDNVRDWVAVSDEEILFPYDQKLTQWPEIPRSPLWSWFFLLRTELWSRSTFGGGTYRSMGRPWYDYHQFPKDRARTPLSIVFAEVATHNHFVLDRGGKVFNRTAPAIKLSREAAVDDHLALLGLLNSSTACFWMKQVCHQKQMMGGDGIRIESKAKVPYAFNATQVGRLPIPTDWSNGHLQKTLLGLTREMDAVSREYAELSAVAIFENGSRTAADIRRRWNETQTRRKELRSKQILLQEEIDFTVYRMFNLSTDDLLSDPSEWHGAMISEGDRPFCIVEGNNEDGFPVPAGIPAPWPAKLRNTWEKRIQIIRDKHELRLIECPMYKRRWIGRQGLFNHLKTDDELGEAAAQWLIDRLEMYFDFDGRLNKDGMSTARLPVALTSIAKLADIARHDADFMQVGELLQNDPAFDVQVLIAEHVGSESVPLLPVLRYKPTGLRKRAEWERTWELQRQEDAIDTRTRLPLTDPQYLTEDRARELKRCQLGDIAAPPKYDGKDFLKSDYSRLRGKLDVPKERWISFPYCEGPDSTPVIAWAGYDHLQLARAISTYFVDIQERFGGRDDSRLMPLLACLIELCPWIKQWHNEPDTAFDGMRMGDYFEGFINEEARQLGKTIPEIKNWTPRQRMKGRGRPSWQGIP